ncbi:MAG: hypothetical protein OXB84_05195 [Halobacteriovoraceae bacterium]|nr:hypothetical protein [Halobacteriovoraceae bacterium]
MKIKIFLLCFLASASAFAQQTSRTEDFGRFFNYLFRGSYLQFTQQNNLVYGLVGGPLLWYGFKNDQSLHDKVSKQNIPNTLEFIGQNLQIIVGFPLIPLIFYQSGRANNKPHRMQFAIEYASAMYLAYLETMLLSYIHIHNRPSSENLSKWERVFRRDSSWPSGHVVPFAVLTFKTLQFYGPWWSLIPATLTLVGGYQRMQSQKHFSSDIIGAILLCAWASEGVRAAAGYGNNHPFYQRVYEGKVKVGLIHHQGVYGPKVTWQY